MGEIIGIGEMATRVLKEEGIECGFGVTGFHSEMFYAMFPQYGMRLYTMRHEQAGWDNCKGMIVFYPEWYGAEEVWPEAVACAREYEARYGDEMGTIAFSASIVLHALTGVLQQAGTVDDLGKIMETIRSGATYDSMVGPVYYGGEDFVGVDCLLMWPVAVWEVVGEREYELLDYYSPEEAEAIAVEAWTATMP